MIHLECFRVYIQPTQRWEPVAEICSDSRVLNDFTGGELTSVTSNQKARIVDVFSLIFKFGG